MVIRFSLPLTGGANRETVAGTPITYAVYISQSDFQITALFTEY